jgi:succinate dehydrogenase / fumarate reductase, cytochrome b subunit
MSDTSNPSMSPKTLPKRARPLSPHLQAYNMFKITSLTSILHRITGAALVPGVLIIVWWLMALAHGPTSYERFLACVTSPFGRLILIGFTWAFWYQLLNGLRHLAWDTGAGFKKKTYRFTGMVSLIGSAVMTALTWAYLWSM